MCRSEPPSLRSAVKPSRPVFDVAWCGKHGAPCSAGVDEITMSEPPPPLLDPPPGYCSQSKERPAKIRREHVPTDTSVEDRGPAMSPPWRRPPAPRRSRHTTVNAPSRRALRAGPLHAHSCPGCDPRWRGRRLLSPAHGPCPSRLIECIGAAAGACDVVYPAVPRRTSMEPAMGPPPAATAATSAPRT